MGLFSKDGGFLSNVGKVFGSITDTLSSLPNEIIDFGIRLGDRQADFLANQSQTVQQEQTQFQSRKASIGFGDFLRNNPYLILGGIGVLIYALKGK